jgi:D-arginine dehydrogenase
MAGAMPLGLVPKRRNRDVCRSFIDVNAKDWPGVTMSTKWLDKPTSECCCVSSRRDAERTWRCAAREIDIAIVSIASAAAYRPVTQFSKLGRVVLVLFRRDAGAVGWTQVERFFRLAGQGGYGIQTGPALGQPAAVLVTGGSIPDAFGVIKAPTPAFVTRLLGPRSE